MKLEINDLCIADNKFACRNDIDELVIADAVTRIGNRAFRDCTNLKSVYFGNNVSSGGSFIFYGCKNISEVFIDDAHALFGFCHDNFGSPLQYGAKLFINGELCTTLHIPDDITDLYSLCTFIGCGSIDTVTVSKRNPSYQDLIEAIKRYNSNLDGNLYHCDGMARPVNLRVLD